MSHKITPFIIPLLCTLFITLHPANSQIDRVYGAEQSPINREILENVERIQEKNGVVFQEIISKIGIGGDVNYVVQLSRSMAMQFKEQMRSILEKASGKLKMSASQIEQDVATNEVIVGSPNFEGVETANQLNNAMLNVDIRIAEYIKLVHSVFEKHIEYFAEKLMQLHYEAVESGNPSNYQHDFFSLLRLSSNTIVVELATNLRQTVLVSTEYAEQLINKLEQSLSSLQKRQNTRVDL